MLNEARPSRPDHNQRIRPAQKKKNGFNEFHLLSALHPKIAFVRDEFREAAARLRLLTPIRPMSFGNQDEWLELGHRAEVFAYFNDAEIKNFSPTKKI